MDAMVSARVPVEIKKRGDSKLKELGATTTELVNAAYRYVIDNGELPGVKTEQSPDRPQTKTLSGDAAKAFERTWATRAVLEAHDYDGANFKELLNAAREDRYARFA